LVIPKVYNGKKKTSFFVHYSLTRGKNLFDSFATVPTQDERQGNFSALCTTGFDVSGVCKDRGPSGEVIHQIYNPTSGSSPFNSPQPFLGNVIFPESLNKPALGLLNYIPLPNLPGQVQNFHLQDGLP